VADEERPDIVVAGASAGGVEAMRKLVSTLPADLDAVVLLVVHLPAEGESYLPQILTRAGKLPVAHPAQGQLLEVGRIYAAPPDRHVLIYDSRIRVVRGPRENRHRPSIDVLFRSAASAYGARVIGVLLTGSDDDGAAGLQLPKRAVAVRTGKSAGRSDRQALLLSVRLIGRFRHGSPPIWFHHPGDEIAHEGTDFVEAAFVIRLQDAQRAFRHRRSQTPSSARSGRRCGRSKKARPCRAASPGIRRACVPG